MVHAQGDHILSGIGEGNTWPLSVRQAAAKIEHQAQTLQVASGRAQAAAQDARTVAVRPRQNRRTTRRVVRATRYAVKPMSIDDAALRLEAGPETFVVFRNAETDAISVLFRRKDGNLGLIEPD